ncbi:hypothetical protein [Sorangium sp. So ce1151]|uniref:hypothetical protein n=1 Tax=Sorangium sp. So ce1151 TaxID=3133332 RepID=UPI003F604D89
MSEPHESARRPGHSLGRAPFVRWRIGADAPSGLLWVSAAPGRRCRTEANRERARRLEEDKRAAQFGGCVEGAGEAAQEAAEAAVDASLQEARARLRSGEEAPILLHDPVTGATIEHS